MGSATEPGTTTTQDFIERGFGIRVGDGYCVVIENKLGVHGWVEDGQRYPLPLPEGFDSIQPIPTNRVAVAFKAYELAHPRDGLPRTADAEARVEGGVMDTLKAGFQLYRLTAECAAILLADYSRDDKKLTLPSNTIFSVQEDAGPIAGVVYNGIAANGKRYRVEAAVLVEKSAKL